MRIREIMCTAVASVSADMKVEEAGAILLKSNFDAVPVVDARRTLVGMFARENLARLFVYGKTAERVAEVMAVDFFPLKEDMQLEELPELKQIYCHTVLPVVNKDNKFAGIVSQADLLMFVSERSLYSAEEMKAVLNSLYNGVIVTNAEGIITLFNETAEFITGMLAKDVVGCYVDDVISTTGLRRVLDTGVPELNQKQMIGKSNIITNRSPIIQNKKIIGAVAVFQDVTELQATMAELETVKDLKSTLESAIESLFEGIVVVDRNGMIKMINRAYCEFLGYTKPQEIIGRHVTSVIPNTRMHLVAKAGKAESQDVQRIGDHNVVVTRIPIVKDGEIVGAVGKVLFRDLKDLKTLYSKINKLQFEVEYYQEELRKVQGGSYTIDNIIGNSEKMKLLKSIAIKVASSNSTVLILGESGTGKELFAHAIHNASARMRERFIKVNCAAVPENLLEAELFGYEEGAYTGARKGGKPGKFELANGGTIFLDEIGDMPLIMQAKLLRVLQEREIERIGGTKPYKLDIRVIAATNCDLETMIAEGKFRQDLYYRLNIISLNIPSLRERREDIPLLCNMLLKKLSSQLNNWVDGVSPEVMALFMQYDWPGNVRELENVLERAVNWMADETVIQMEHLPPIFHKQTKSLTSMELPSTATDLFDIKENAEKQAIQNALEACGGNRSRAAKLLGINRSGFYQKLNKYNMK